MIRHRLEKFFCAWQKADTPVLFAMQGDYVQVEFIAPVIEAIPVELALETFEGRVQVIPRMRLGDVVLTGVFCRYMLHPHVVVVGKIEQGAVHIEHQRIAAVEQFINIVRLLFHSNDLYCAA